MLNEIDIIITTKQTLSSKDNINYSDLFLVKFNFIRLNKFRFEEVFCFCTKRAPCFAKKQNFVFPYKPLDKRP